MSFIGNTCNLRVMVSSFGAGEITFFLILKLVDFAWALFCSKKGYDFFAGHNSQIHYVFHFFKALNRGNKFCPLFIVSNKETSWQSDCSRIHATKNIITTINKNRLPNSLDAISNTYFVGCKV